MGNDIYLAVKEFFANGRLMRQWNHSIIALVPKTKDASSVNDFRPFSCCTVLYKIISKVLVGRLRRVIGGLVDDAQAAYFMADLLWIIFTMLRSFFESMLGN